MTDSMAKKRITAMEQTNSRVQVTQTLVHFDRGRLDPATRSCSLGLIEPPVVPISIDSFDGSGGSSRNNVYDFALMRMSSSSESLVVGRRRSLPPLKATLL